MIRAVLFDVGETLLTSEEPEEIHQMILAEKKISKEIDEIKDALKNGSQKFSKKHGRDKIRKMDMDKPVLNKLSAMGLQPGLVSNGFRAEMLYVLGKVGLDRSLFSVIVGRDTAGAPKPDPRPFLHAAGSLGLKPEEIIFVGDSFHNDYEGSQGVGMKPVLILRGRQPPAEAPDDITTIQTLDEIMNLVQLFGSRG